MNRLYILNIIKNMNAEFSYLFLKVGIKNASFII